MNAVKKRGYLHAGRLLFACLLSYSVLAVCSKSSFLYPMNDWVDVHCFFTVGRGILHGLTPYRDLYEQKGPLVYFFYALAAQISEGSFLGVYLLEGLCFAAFVHLGGKTAALLSGRSAAYWPAALALAGALLLLNPWAALRLSQNTYLMQVPREDMPPYRFAQIIRQSEDQTLLNYGFLDGGFYFAAGVQPAGPYFCTLNISLPDMEKALDDSIRQGKTAFVITRSRPLKDSGPYRLADEAEMTFEGRVWKYYLYQRSGGDASPGQA